MKKRILYIAFLLSGLFELRSQETNILLQSPWKFRKMGTTSWYAAFVPGNIFTDLYKNKLIADPFYSDNEKKLQWIEKETWEYSCDFKCNPSMLSRKHIECVFEGLDTYASVFVNDSLVLSSDNMFRSWRVDVKKHLTPGTNVLKVIFEPAVLKGLAQAKQLPYVLPEGERVFTRKAQFQYGWDFGPRYAGCGIWKPVQLMAWDDVRIKSVHAVSKSITDSLARMEFIVETICDNAGAFQFELRQLSDERIKVHGEGETESVYLKAGSNTDTFSVLIHKPKLWWCNGLGKPYLYTYNLSLIKGNVKKDQAVTRFGIRTVELINNSDTAGTSFYFKLNGVPVFVKGANYIPNDIFLKPLTKKEYSEEIALCKNAHMNMLRIWGGGVYPDDSFYEACDEQGILVWQDFMFACAMYPGDEKFINTAKEEIREQITRLRNHPSLAMWCGNNENDEGWKNWGWQKQFGYSKTDSIKIWEDYQHLFHYVIPAIKMEFDPATPYWSSSPFIGWGRKESLKRGDSHYWGVWWGMEPFDIYKVKIGRFMSEYGFQSMPHLNTFKAFCPYEELNLSSPAVKMHQKHKTGYETIETYLKRDYKLSSEFQKQIYLSQLLQRDGMKTAIESHRKNKPYCMGTLFWQLNDCWPGTSWSALDYYKRPKAFYFALSELYKTQLLAVSDEKDVLEIKCISDSVIKYETELNVKLVNFRSGLIWEYKRQVELDYSKVAKLEIQKKELPAFDTTACYLKVELIAAGKVQAGNFYFFVKPRYLALPKTSINIAIRDSKTLEISSDFFSKDVYIYNENGELNMETNYFNLEAGEKKKIKIDQKEKKLNVKDLKVICLNNL